MRFCLFEQANGLVKVPIQENKLPRNETGCHIHTPKIIERKANNCIFMPILTCCFMHPPLHP